MRELPIVQIVLARCRRNHQPFGIRFEEKSPESWVGDWAFEVQEAWSRREGYDHGVIHGSFSFDQAYPGCPYCGSPGLVLCGCSKATCWDTDARVSVCAWCGQSGEISGQVNRLSSGNDR
jgi:hypothetical protein